MTGSNRHAIVFIFITMLIDVMGLGIILPILPKLIATIGHTGMDEAARIGAALMFAYAGMQFLFAPLLGNLSDRYGRRPILILSLVGIGIDYVIMGLAPTLAWLFAGRLLSGMAGASFTTAAAYIADVSPPEKRAQNFGMIGAAFGVGFVLGPMLGGLIGHYGVRLPFLAAAALAAANAIYGAVVLKESLAPDHRRKFEAWRANPLGALIVLKRYPIVLPLCGVLILMRLAHDANPTVFSYYTMLKFGWGPREVGLSLMAVGVVTAVCYAILPRFARRIGEDRSVYIGLAGGAIAFLGYALASQGWMIFAFMLPFGLVCLVMPSLNAILARAVGPKGQGELQGALTSGGSLTSVFAPLILGNLFAWFSGPHAPVYFPGAAFAAAALFLVLAALWFAVIRSRMAQSAKGADEPAGDRQFSRSGSD
jgi:MFS transporter, DHA1 family, tetracycline resistance protein